MKKSARPGPVDVAYPLLRINHHLKLLAAGAARSDRSGGGDGFNVAKDGGTEPDSWLRLYRLAF